MNQLPSSKLAEPSLPAHLPDTADEAVFDTLNRLAEKPCVDLRSAPSVVDCRRAASLVPAMLSAGTEWEPAVGHATRLASVLPAAKSDDMDKALAITEMAKAFFEYPQTVAEWTASHLMASRRFRPVPADIHEAAKSRLVHLRAAAIVAERVISARQEAEVERLRLEAEAREEAFAKAEGRETPSERRARIASEARAAIRSPAA